MTTPTLCDLIESRLAYLREKTGRTSLTLLETGSIRSAELAYRDGDGWSTVGLATHVRLHGGSFTSIDLDTRTAASVLASHSLTDCANLVDAYSIDRLAHYLTQGMEFDFILLDTANDAALTLHEYMLARRIITEGGIIMIDDVEPGSKDVVKGNDVVPHLLRTRQDYELLKRSKNDVVTGVAVVSC